MEAGFSSSHTHHILHGFLHYLIANKYVETPCDNIRTLVDQVKHNGSLFSFGICKAILSWKAIKNPYNSVHMLVALVLSFISSKHHLS